MAEEENKDTLDRIRVVTIDKKDSRLEKAKKIIEIVAIVVGGIWAYFNFTVKDKPSIEDAFVSESTININRDIQDSCLVKYGIEVHNIGKSSFEVNSLILSYWTFSISEVKKKVFFNIDDYTKGKPDTTFKMVGSQTLLNDSYPPGVGKEQDFTFFIKRDKSKGIIFRYILRGKASRFLWWDCSLESVGHKWMYPIAPGETSGSSDKEIEEK